MRILGFSQRVLQPIDGCLAAFDGQYCARTFSDDTRSLNFVEDRAPIETADQESCMSSTLRDLASIGFKLHRFSSPVQLPESVYVFLRL
jgi:hypothetical protein